MSTRYAADKNTREITKELFELLGKSARLPFKLIVLHFGVFEARDSKFLRQRIWYYKSAGAILGNSKDGFYLSKDGLARLQEIEMSRIKMGEKSWDKTWRIIAFDIPEEKREARDAIRRLIKQLGCQQLQRSLWIHPLPCLDQFRHIQEAYGIEDHIILIETQWIQNHKKIYQQFKKEYPAL